MRYLKAALAGLLGGLLLAFAAMSVEMIHAQRTVAAQMASCADYVCDGYAQVGGVWELLIAFALGFAAAFVWFLRRQRSTA